MRQISPEDDFHKDQMRCWVLSCKSSK